jgi:hypothetical protein
VSDPEQHQEQDELDLDAETVRDLEPNESDAEDVRGGLADPEAFLSTLGGSCKC